MGIRLTIVLNLVQLLKMSFMPTT